MGNSVMFGLSVRLASVAATLAVMAACGKGDSSPTAPSGPPAANPCMQSQGCPSIDSIGFWFRISSNDGNGSGDPWTFTFLDKMYTASGNAEYGLINMTPGDYQVSGTFPTSSFSMTLGRQAGGKGGVVIGSVKSLEGPVSATQFSPGCGVAYFVPFGAPKPNQFKIQFSIATGTEGC
jgi:hypothetical protein